MKEPAPKKEKQGDLPVSLADLDNYVRYTANNVKGTFFI
jgi:hypothetical protein